MALIHVAEPGARQYGKDKSYFFQDGRFSLLQEAKHVLVDSQSVDSQFCSTDLYVLTVGSSTFIFGMTRIYIFPHIKGI